MAVVKSPKNNKRKILWIKKFNNNNKKKLLINKDYNENNNIPKTSGYKNHLNWKDLNFKKKIITEYCVFFNE